VGKALAAAVADTVAVAEGQYQTHVTLGTGCPTRRLPQRFRRSGSVAYPSVLDAGGFGTVVARRPEPLTVLDGFVITGGNRSGGYGGGLDCFLRQTISHNVFVASCPPGAIACRAVAVPSSVTCDRQPCRITRAGVYVETAAQILSNIGNRGPSASGIA
jgi:hypothetical protein